MKPAGAALVLLGALWGRWIFFRERRRRRAALADLRLALFRMAEEIRAARTPLPLLLSRAAETCGPEAAAFLLSAQRGESLREAWREAADRLPLSGGDRRALRDLGEDLRGDEEHVRKALSAAAARLEESAAALDASARDESRSVTALTLSAAALVVILLF